MVEVGAERGGDRERNLSVGVGKLQAFSDQEHPLDVPFMREFAIVAMIAMAVIPDNRMGDAIKMTADLMPTPCFGAGLDHRVTARFKLTRRPRNLKTRKGTKTGTRRLKRTAGLLVGFPFFVEPFAQRQVNDAVIAHPAAHNGPIRFENLATRKQLVHTRRCLRVECIHNYTRGRSVQAMHWKKKTSNLIAQQSQQDRFVSWCRVGTMHQQASRLVDSDQVFIAIENRQWWKLKLRSV